MANPFVNGSNSASPQSVYSTYTDQAHPIGVRATIGDRAFRYSRFTTGTAIGPNKVAQSLPLISNHAAQTGANTGIDTVNATQITVTLGATAAMTDQYRDGYLRIQDATLGLGQFFKLKGHTFVAASGVLTANLYDPVVTATTGTQTWTLTANPWADPVILVASGSTQTGVAVGVPLVNIAASTTTTGTSIVPPSGYLTTSVSGSTYTYTSVQYGWLQTWGPCSVLLDASATVAGSGIIGGTVAGSVGVAVETDIKQRIGVAMSSLTASGKYHSIFLQIAP